MAQNLQEPSMWCELDEYLTLESAEIDAAFLRSEGVPARVAPVYMVPGEYRSIRLMVNAALEHRARWLLKTVPVSEEELEFLATGVLPNSEHRE